MKKVLIIEDDKSTRAGIIEALQIEQYICDEADDGQIGFEMALKGNYSLILLDLMLPLKSGMDICKDLRNKDIMTPIIMLTGKKEEVDKIVGLELGADDYITKPFSIRELLTRIKAVLRRSDFDNVKKNEIEFGDIKINFKKQELYKSEEEIKLSTTEFKVLHYLIEHEGEVISRNQLLDEVWGYDAFPTTRTVDNYILSLRKKIEDNPTDPVYLLTVHKAGYKFVMD
ncbi:MAG: response regulator transcription factor [Ignavibacteriaceae bacterium]|nr:response regulator transcription factor [Ignavibacteriaceae bacterium]